MKPQTLAEALAQDFSVVDFVIAFEAGELTEEEIHSGFQELINSGIVWSLQGHYGRTACALIDSGICRVRQY